jgi:hypothetical protein
MALAVQNGNRITIGATKFAPADGNGLGAGEETVITLQFRVLLRDRISSIGIAVPDNPVALNSSGSVIDSIDFDDSPIGVSGQ